MKKIYILSLALALFASSCLKEEKDIFSSSAIDRLNQAIKEDKELLIGAENGWLMQYFATSESRGYNLIMKFDETGAVTVGTADYGFNGGVYEEATSLFDVIGDNGPVLTFNTYNDILHTFSNPVNPNGYGLRGDYEFIIEDASADKITTKGKKRWTSILMTKMAEGKSWQEYFEETNLIDQLLFRKNPYDFILHLNDKEYSLSGGSTHIFSIPLDPNNEEDVYTVPFITSPTGIRLHAPLNINGQETDAQTFVLNDDKSLLVSVEDPDVKIGGPSDLGKYFIDSAEEWTFNEDSFGSDLKGLYDQVIESALNFNLGVTRAYAGITYSVPDDRYYVELVYFQGRQTMIGLVGLDVNRIGEDQLELKLDVDATSPDATVARYIRNGQYFIERMVGFPEFIEAIQGNYTLSTEYRLNPTNGIRFVDNTNKNKSFFVIPSL